MYILSLIQRRIYMAIALETSKAVNMGNVIDNVIVGTQEYWQYRDLAQQLLCCNIVDQTNYEGDFLHQ